LTSAEKLKKLTSQYTPHSAAASIGIMSHGDLPQAIAILFCAPDWTMFERL
jgi:hypothetical protein